MNGKRLEIGKQQYDHTRAAKLAAFELLNSPLSQVESNVIRLEGDSKQLKSASKKLDDSVFLVLGCFAPDTIVPLYNQLLDSIQSSFN